VQTTLRERRMQQWRQPAASVRQRFRWIVHRCINRFVVWVVLVGIPANSASGSSILCAVDIKAQVSVVGASRYAVLKGHRCAPSFGAWCYFHIGTKRNCNTSGRRG